MCRCWCTGGQFVSTRSSVPTKGSNFWDILNNFWAKWTILKYFLTAQYFSWTNPNTNVTYYAALIDSSSATCFPLWNHKLWSRDTETHTPAMSGNESDVKSDHIALAAGQREPGKGAELGNLCRFWSSCCKKGQQGPWTLQLRASL